MAERLNYSEHIIFLGLADHWQGNVQPFPLGGIDLYQLSRHKQHIVYPGLIGSNEWVLLVSYEFLRSVDLTKWSIRICDDNDHEVGTYKILKQRSLLVGEEVLLDQEKGNFLIYQQDSKEFSLLHFSINATIHNPGRYIVQSIYENKINEIGSVYFHYQKSPALTPEQIKANEADPHSVKTIMMSYGCKICSSKLSVYTGLNRSPDIEEQGYIWYQDLDSEFSCQCGKSTFSLEYLKESMHGMLLKDFSTGISNLSYVHSYGHQQVIKIVDEFNKLLDLEKMEQPIQKHLEEHPVLLSRFFAKSLFIKPNIIGRFQADFVILDSKKQLWFIELERPSLQLFTKIGHPTSDFMHAYEQVNDWLVQYSKYHGAILEQLNLNESEIVAIRGAVIAGRRKSIPTSTLQRHLFNPPYPNIEFLTLDDLGMSLIEISRTIA